MKPFLIILLLFSLIFPTSCDEFNIQKEKGVQQPLLVCVFFDLSGSTKTLRQTYLAAFKQLLSQLSDGDTVVIGKITSSSITEREIIKETLPRFVPLDPGGRLTDNSYLIKKARVKADKKTKEKKEDLLSTVERLLLAEKTPKTDIISSLHVAERIFKTYKAYNIIFIIFSDMAETAAFNLYRENLTDVRIDQILKKERADGRLPDLEGVTVFIVGCGTEGTERFFALRKFWLRYFEECKANLQKKNYGSDYALIQIK